MAGNRIMMPSLVGMAITQGYGDCQGGRGLRKRRFWGMIGPNWGRTAMKALLGAVALVLGTGAAMAGDAAEGMWKTLPDDNGNFGHIQIAPCGAALCGTLVKSFDGTGAVLTSDNIGKNVVWDMVPAAGGAYENGKVWTPDRDKTYDATMQLTGDTLAVSGCVMGGLICRASNWTRVK
jgi:uncharacterized protein (DUF2147 family)